MRNIHFISPNSGNIGEISRDLIQFLGSYFNVTVTMGPKREDPMDRELLLVHFMEAHEINTQFFDTFKKKVLIQPIDGSAFSEEMIRIMHQFDLIITPSTACKNTMEKNGIQTPITIVPNYWIPNMVNYNKFSIPVKPTEFVFYHETLGQKRKRTLRIVKSFVSAFTKVPGARAALIIKTDSKTERKIEKLLDELRPNYEIPNIFVNSEFLDFDRLKFLWKFTDCYISASGAEGFGIPLLRMAVMNKKIIALHHESFGYMDFLESDYMIKDVFPVKANDFHLYDETKNQWIDYDDKDMEAQMLRAIEAGKSTDNTYNPKWDQYLQYNVMSKYKEILESI